MAGGLCWTIVHCPHVGKHPRAALPTIPEGDENVSTDDDEDMAMIEDILSICMSPAPPTSLFPQQWSERDMMRLNSTSIMECENTSSTQAIMRSVGMRMNMFASSRSLLAIWHMSNSDRCPPRDYSSPESEVWAATHHALFGPPPPVNHKRRYADHAEREAAERCFEAMLIDGQRGSIDGQRGSIDGQRSFEAMFVEVLSPSPAQVLHKRRYAESPDSVLDDIDAAAFARRKVTLEAMAAMAGQSPFQAQPPYIKDYPECNVPDETQTRPYLGDI